jgi:hypothetical protein
MTAQQYRIRDHRVVTDPAIGLAVLTDLESSHVVGFDDGLPNDEAEGQGVQSSRARRGGQQCVITKSCSYPGLLDGLPNGYQA